MGGHVGGAHFAAPRYAAGGARFAAGSRFAGALPHTAVHGSAYYMRPGGGYAPGAGTTYWHGGYWGGGYWHGWYGGFWGGVYWPRVFYYPGFVWFWPVLPFGYVTYWWGGVPYYYWNNLYYTYSPADNGYVVTDPPPVEANAGAAATDQGAAQAGAASSGASVYVYPRSGQSTEQTQNDRYECHSWAVNQTGFDPTRSSQQSSGSVVEYRRALIACLDARGYSAR